MSDEKKVPMICGPDGFCRPGLGPIHPLLPHPVCVLTISYPHGSPEQPTIAMDAKVCDNPEVALAVLLAALLKANLP